MSKNKYLAIVGIFSLAVLVLLSFSFDKVYKTAFNPESLKAEASRATSKKFEFACSAENGGKLPDECYDSCSTVIQTKGSNAIACVFSDENLINQWLENVAKVCGFSGGFKAVWKSVCYNKKTKAEIDKALQALRTSALRIQNEEKRSMCLTKINTLTHLINTSWGQGAAPKKVTADKSNWSQACKGVAYGATKCVEADAVGRNAGKVTLTCEQGKVGPIDGGRTPTGAGGPTGGNSFGLGGSQFDKTFNCAFGMEVKNPALCLPQGQGGAQAGLQPQGSGQNMLNTLFGQMFGKMFGQQFNRLFGGGGDSAGSGRHKCDSYWYRIFHKKECTPPQPVACILLPSKTKIKKGESINLVWEVRGASSYELTFDPQMSVDKHIVTSSVTADSIKETVLISPKSSGNIILSATGEGDDNICKVVKFIEVEGTSTTTPDENKTNIVCSPTTIPNGFNTEINLSWKCLKGNYSSVVKKMGDNSVLLVRKLATTTGSIKDNTNQATTYELYCYDTSTSTDYIDSDKCFVSAGVSKAEIIAYPNEVEVGEKAKISWVSVGTDSCRVTGPNRFYFENNSGSVVTTPFPEGSDEDIATYTLECTDSAGNSVSKDVIIRKK